VGQLVGNLRRFDPKTVRICEAVVIVVAVLVALIVSAAGGGSSDSSASSPAPESSATLTETSLIEAGAASEQPLYWLGAQAGVKRFELTNRNESEQIYIRYLPASGGTASEEPLTVGTYRVPDARAALRRAQASEAEELTLSSHPGYELLSGPDAESAFVVFDDQPDLQIEVYSPKPGEAEALVNDGDLTPLK
jgi:hypothetical protein